MPVKSLNQLESLALDILTYDLSIQPQEWSSWLARLSSYHASLSSSSCPQPISRPSTSPHTIIRKAIESLSQIRLQNSPCSSCGEELCTSGPPAPVFVTAEDKRKGETETSNRRPPESVDVLEINLDEDGPLREEYLPRRRTSGSSSNGRDNTTAGVLPPPAKWSPSADEPIISRASQLRAAYVAPRPIGQPSMQMMQAAPAFPKPYDSRDDWSMEDMDYPGLAAFTYAGYEYPYPSFQGHSRSQSLSYNQAIGESSHGRFRSYSHTRYDQPYSDVRLSGSQYLLPPQVASRWSSHGHRARAAWRWL